MPKTPATSLRRWDVEFTDISDEDQTRGNAPPHTVTVKARSRTDAIKEAVIALSEGHEKCGRLRFGAVLPAASGKKSEPQPAIADIRCPDCGKTAVIELSDDLITLTCDHCDLALDFTQASSGEPA